jgi:hypothetical protein
MASIKAHKMNAQNVSVQGKLELRGQRLIKAYNEARATNMTIEELEDMLSSLTEKMVDADPDTAAMYSAEYDGYSLALRYAKDITESLKEYTLMRKELRDAESNRELTYREKAQLVEQLRASMLDNRVERIHRYSNFIDEFSRYLDESIEGAKDFNEAQKRHQAEISAPPTATLYLPQTVSAVLSKFQTAEQMPICASLQKQSTTFATIGKYNTNPETTAGI